MFERLGKLKLPDWPWTGLILSAVFLGSLAILPCLWGDNCYQQADARQQYGQSRQPLTIVSPQAMRAKAEQPAKPCENPPSGCISVWTAWAWYASARYMARIRDEPVALFTALLFLSTSLLWWVTQRTLRHAKKSSELQLRAYIQIDETSTKKLKVGEKYGVEVQFGNSGQTPAYEVDARWSVRTTDLVDPPEGFFVPVEKPGRTYSKATLGPKTKTAMNCRGKEPLTEDDVQQFNDGKAIKFIFGCITYRDIFGHDQKTTFRLRHRVTTAYRGLEVCSKGNSAT